MARPDSILLPSDAQRRPCCQPRRRAILQAAAWSAAAAALQGCTAVATDRPGAPLRPSAAPAAQAAAAWGDGTKLVLLGTMAGPVLHPARAMSSQAIVVDGRIYLVDCGYGTIERMTQVGMRLPEVADLFVTHHHSDHTADYPAFVNLSWILGIKGTMGVYGPPPMRQVHESALAVFAEDASIRVKATGRQPPQRSFDVHEVRAAGPVFQDDRVRVTAALVDHQPFEVALAYRFDTAKRSIVISGDTAPSPALVELARGADVLVHEAMLVEQIDAMLAKRPYVPPNLKRFLTSGHTTAEDAGRIAAQAGVKTLVLSHLLPGDEPVPDAVWRSAAQQHFNGEIIVGRDGLVI